MSAIDAIQDAPARSAPEWSLRDVAVEVFYNGRLILVCLGAGLAIGLAGLGLARTEYTAESQVLVRAAAEPSPREGLSGPAMPLAGDAVQRIVQSDVQIIGSDPVIAAALGDMRQGAGARQVEGLRARLHISAEPNSGLIRVQVKAPSREAALVAARAILKAYARRRIELYLAGPAPRQEGLLRRSEAELDRLAGAIDTVRRRYGVLDIAQQIQLADADLDVLDQRLSQARERQSAALGERSAARTGLAHTPPSVFQSHETTNATPNDDAHNTLLRLRQERAHIAAQYAANWPGLVEIDGKIAAAQAEIAANARDLRHSDLIARNPVMDQLSGRMTALNLELAALAPQLEAIAREQTAARARLAVLRGADAELHDLERQRGVQEGIQRQLAIARTSGELADAAMDDSAAALRIVQPPSAPSKGVNLGPTYLLAGALLGAATALASTAVASVFRRRYITARAAELGLDLPVLAETQASASALGRPEAAEAVGGLATLLGDIRLEGRALKIVQIVGAQATHKAALALALGAAMARRAAGPVLIVDFDLEGWYQERAPKDAERRLKWADGQLALAPAALPGLWIATRTQATPLGDPHAPVETLRAWAEVLRQSFALVLFVAPGAFADYPARRLYPLADANILLIDSQTTRTPTARRVRDVVLAAGGDLLGFVFTSRRHFIPEPVLKWL